MRIAATIDHLNGREVYSKCRTLRKHWLRLVLDNRPWSVIQIHSGELGTHVFQVLVLEDTHLTKSVAQPSVAEIEEAELLYAGHDLGKQGPAELDLCRIAFHNLHAFLHPQSKGLPDLPELRTDPASAARIRNNTPDAPSVQLRSCSNTAPAEIAPRTRHAAPHLPLRIA